ncbi:hypothetical protein BDA96_09G215900 [Sorghum bicolor]|uniref:Uncharacterized protein n=2 Tax=Sorghum bicolor TaxID=4558 RepID=A0A921U5U4_SORBI|nr:hypothetical protein BDA96_09G215900 [Sorghum bicolor]OQU78331.1 hypothetical protein SORBI_3009G204501 [Sorghum bicolor]
MELSCSEEESKSERVQRYKKMRSNGKGNKKSLNVHLEHN